MKRSASVALGVVTALATARAQQSGDPCDAATFNAKVCQAAVRGGSYCSHGARVATRYQQSYPYYYDRYQNYMSQGGVVSASPAETCPGHSSPIRGGFGSTASAHATAMKPGS
jgi:hypothetical protein